MSTTLPLFWNLSSNSKKERIDASVKLIGALERFQAEFTPQESTSEDDEEGDEDAEEGKKKGDGLDVLNAADVSYSIRRLVRGLASPRESSRLGFAVALTELLLRIDTITCAQVVALILDASRTHGSSTGQEERDVLFARLFGLTAVIQSGLVVRDTPLTSSASSSTTASDSSAFANVVSQLLSLSDAKSWLRESAWWSLGLAIDRLGASTVQWRDEALASVIDTLYVKNKAWTPEKVALTVKLQKALPSADWKNLLAPTFKYPDVLASGNFAGLARILKDVGFEDDTDADAKANAGQWTPNVPFVWDILLDEVLAPSSSIDSSRSSAGSFPEFFRLLVDESLFAASSSPERKYWGFQVFRKSLSRASAADIPMLFTKNFMRTWINHLSNSDRYLHKAAKQVANDILGLVKQNPKLGFTLILQLTGVNGSHQFDRLTKTKTVETILTSMDVDGIQEYIDYLLQQVNEKEGSNADDISAINARRIWIVDQLSALLRNGAVPKNDVWVQRVLDWLIVHGLCAVRKKSEKSALLALHVVPSPIFSDDLRQACRSRLLSCLAELTGQASLVQAGDKAVKVTGAAVDGQLWLSRCLSTSEQLQDDNKHLKWLTEIDEEDRALRQSALRLVRRLSKVSGEKEDLARGTELLIAASLIQRYCADNDDAENDNEEEGDPLQDCVDAAQRLFPEKKKQKKTESDSHGEPVDVLVDVVIRFLEMGTTFMRSVANQAFTLLSGSLQSTSIDLIVAQLIGPDSIEEDESPDDAMDKDAASEDEAEESSDSGDDNDDEDEDIEEDSQLRAAIEEALKVNGIRAAVEDDSEEESEEDLMDDDQMMAVDAQLAAVFKARAEEKGRGNLNVQREATHFKNRALDLVDVYLKKHASSALAIRFISPLTEVIAGSSSDEKQLTDKATGILRSRLGKTKETPSIIDKEHAVAILQELHVRARTAVSSDILVTLSSCCLYLCRALLHADAQKEVVDAYDASLADFMSRKASRLNSQFFQEFLRRYPAVGWDLRDAMIERSREAVNGYRRAQAYQLLQTVMNQLSTLHEKNDEILAFMPLLSKNIEDVITTACEDGSLTPAQAKEVLKLAQSAARQTKRVASTPEEVSTIWKPSRWQALSDKLAKSDPLKASTGLQNICNQLAQLAASGTATKSGQESSKRKMETAGNEDAIAKPAKRKKVRKTKT